MNELTLNEAAAELSVTTATLRQQLAAGRLHGRKLGPLWLVTRRELDRYKATSHQKPGRKPTSA